MTISHHTRRMMNTRRSQREQEAASDLPPTEEQGSLNDLQLPRPTTQQRSVPPLIPSDLPAELRAFYNGRDVRTEANEPTAAPRPEPPQATTEVPVDDAQRVMNHGKVYDRERDGPLRSPVPAYNKYFERYGQRFDLDPRLLVAVTEAESSFNPRAISPKGARGLMQLMPGTARDLDVKNPFDPEENIRGGAEYLRGLLDRFGVLEHALAAFNAGPRNVEKHGGVPPFQETRRYVRRVIESYERLKSA